MLASVHSAILLGVEGRSVRVEVHVSTGLPGYSIVGLPDTAVRESRERVRAAMLSSEFVWPNQRITVNLAPAGLRKQGAGLELAVALGLLVAAGTLPAECIEGVGVLGELGLDGAVRPVVGGIALVDALRRDGATSVIVPFDNAPEAGLIEGVRVLPARRLGDVRQCLAGDAPWPEPPATATPEPDATDDDPNGGDLADVRGLPHARLALEAAAAGGHHLLMVGPPGAGKTMLAHRFGTILPPLEADGAMEVTRIHSVAGRVAHGLETRPPFRAPHHTATTAALVGGGSARLSPGEVTLAHRGVLFLDELGEFPPRALDALRQPLEERVVRIARQGASVAFPASFVLLACSNPCPCGLGPPRCRCTDTQRARYRRRLSAPLLDRFDLRVTVRPPAATDTPGPCSADVRTRVLAACARQARRLHGTPWDRNAHVPARALPTLNRLNGDAADVWQSVVEERGLTGRGAARVQRVARTLADLRDAETVDAPDVLLAADFREEVL